MKPEALLYTNRIKPTMDRIPGIEFERVELRVGAPGFPDVVYTLGGTGFVELKVSGARGHISLQKWTGVQRSWAKRHCRAGSRVFLGVGVGGQVALLSPVLCLQERTVPLDHPSVLALWPKVPDPVEFASFLRY